jgi:hypothetical protein
MHSVWQTLHGDGLPPPFATLRALSYAFEAENISAIPAKTLSRS